MAKEQKKIAGEVVIGNKPRGIIYLGRPSLISMLLSSISMTLVIASLTAIGIPVLPMVWYRISPGTSDALAKVLVKPVTTFEAELVAAGVKDVYQPEQDSNLSKDNRLIIPSIGVNTLIIEEPVERYEEAFRKGSWRVPDFGTPFERQRPMIIAAHRFGYLAWTNDFRKRNSFFNLPKLKIGDTVEVIWDQRRYVYEIYDEEEGVEITNYTADLILYTCKFLESDIRIFKYARLLEL
jgi:hypothetical protein